MTDIKEVIVVSGKGGTGKTSVVGPLVSLMTNRVAADCDVDAANLHMILNPVIIEEKEFIGGKKATIDPSRCTSCGTCRDVCRFQAISADYIVDHRQCEGCGACYFLCPANAIDFPPLSPVRVIYAKINTLNLTCMRNFCLRKRIQANLLPWSVVRQKLWLKKRLPLIVIDALQV